jgi:hypothetical protein
MKAKYDQFVHEFETENGETRYAVAHYNPESGQYTCPLDSRMRKLTGCTAEYANTPAGIGGYPTKRQALRRARYLFAD